MNQPTTTISQARQLLAGLGGVPLAGAAAQLRSHLAAVLALLELDDAQQRLLADVFDDAIASREGPASGCPDCEQADRDGLDGCQAHAPGVRRAQDYDDLARRLYPLGLLPGR